MSRRTTGIARLSKRRVFAGRVFSIEVDRVRLPGGSRSTLEIVRHRGSVVLLPQPTPRELILVRQYRHAIGRWIWELPAGSLEAGEAPARAARRECEEETGWRPRRLRRLGLFYPTPGFCDEAMTFYQCTELERPARPATGDADEELTPRVFTLAQVRSLIDRREVRDMKTVVGLWLLTTRRR